MSRNVLTKNLYIVTYSSGSDSVIANSVDEASLAVETVRTTTPTAVSQTSSGVIVNSADVSITVTISPTAASSDGAAIYPTSFTSTDTSTVIMTAVDGSTYSFDHWEDQDGATLSSTTPYSLNVSSSITEIVGVFTL